MGNQWSKSFDKCPHCGGAPFFQGLAEDLKRQGRGREEWHFFLDSKVGVVTDPEKAKFMPVGAELPGYSFATDICEDCGAIWATRLEKAVAHVTGKKPPPGLIVPAVKGFPPFFGNSPSLS